MQHLSRAVLGTCFFLSGAAGLVYEVAWSRWLHLIFGSTTYSITTVVATYMFGLGAGSLLFGRAADRSPNPARLYAWVEIGIGAYALLTPLLMAAVRAVFVALHHAIAPGPATGALLKAVLAAAVLAPPTVLMGGTLPLLARHLVTRGDEAARGVGLLYGLNTLGAVAGTAAAGFVLIEHLGLTGSIAAAAAVNVAIGVAVLALSRGAAPAVSVTTAEPVASPGWRGLRIPALLAFLAGLGSLVAEVVWSRALTLVIGSSTYAFTLILVAFLLGIGLGSALISRRGPGNEPHLGLAAAQLLAAAGVTLSLVGLKPVVYAIAWAQQNPLSGFASLFAVKAAVVLAAVLPATLGMGMSFPLVIALLPARRERIGTEVAIAYGANTLGSIAGALGAGFFLLTRVGSFRTLELAAAIHLAAAALALASARGIRWRRTVPVAAAVGAIAVVVATAPPWPAHLLSSGAFLYSRGMASTAAELGWFLESPQKRVRYFREGLSSVVAVWEMDYTRALKVNGKTDASSGRDMETQIFLGLRPALAHPAPRDVLVIGAGSGVTVRALAAVAGVRSIDVVEIEEAVLDAGPFFRDVTGDIWHDPRVHVVLEDGRNFLLTTRKHYDIIVSEPSNPWMAGVANLFTSEFYALVRAHLAPGGIFCQWVQLYDLSVPTLRRMTATLVASFPETEAWRSGSADFEVLCAEQPFASSVARAQFFRAGNPGLARDLRIIAGLEDGEDDLTGLVLDRTALVAFSRGLKPFADDPPELEFQALRSLGGTPWFPAVRAEFLAARAGRPQELRLKEPLAPGFDDYSLGRVLLDWDDVGRARESFEASTRASPSASRRFRWLAEAELRLGNRVGAVHALEQAIAASPGYAPARIRLAELMLAAGDLAGAEVQLRALPRGPETDDAPLWMVEAEAAVAAGDFTTALRRLADLGGRLRAVPDPDGYLGRMLPLYDRIASAPGFTRLALDQIEAEVQRAPTAPVWSSVAAGYLERMEQPALALAHYQHILAIGPHPDAMAGEVRTLLAIGRRAEAARALRVPLAAQPWNPELVALARALAAAP